MGKLIRMDARREITGKCSIVKGEREVEAWLIPAKKSQHKGFVIMFDTGLEELVSKGLKGQEYQTILYMISKMDFKNHVDLEQVNMAADLGISKQNFSKILSSLFETHRLIVPYRKVGKVKFWMVSPSLGCKVSQKVNQELIQEFDDLVTHHLGPDNYLESTNEAKTKYKSVKEFLSA